MGWQDMADRAETPGQLNDFVSWDAADTLICGTVSEARYHEFEEGRETKVLTVEPTDDPDIVHSEEWLHISMPMDVPLSAYQLRESPELQKAAVGDRVFILFEGPDEHVRKAGNAMKNFRVAVEFMSKTPTDDVPF